MTPDVEPNSRRITDGGPEGYDQKTGLDASGRDQAGRTPDEANAARVNSMVREGFVDTGVRAPIRG